ncbi:hypothetical protein [Spongiimicrobium salis]|uniref:hypothetical protein n=1 Tax=Spongiimicrobium salis TaxID=1667022 RepID=UPI00374D7DA0
MKNWKLTKEQEYKGFKEIIPEVYPDNIEDCLNILKNIKYKSFGFGMMYLYYRYDNGCWSVIFRNARNFENEISEEKEALKSLHKAFDFLKNLHKNL